MNRIKKAKKYVWNEETEKNFEELNKAFTEGGIQAFPNFGVGDLFILTTDWNKENISWGSVPGGGREGMVPVMLGKEVQ